MSEYKTIARLNPGHDYWEIFPDGEVPIVSLTPYFVAGCPEPCFFIDARKLTNPQLVRIAKDFMCRMPSVFPSIDHAVDALSKGFPLLLRHFCGAESTDPIAFGSSMVIHRYSSFEDFSNSHDLIECDDGERS
jgi:hypothetical protein